MAKRGQPTTANRIFRGKWEPADDLGLCCVFGCTNKATLLEVGTSRVACRQCAITLTIPGGGSDRPAKDKPATKIADLIDPAIPLGVCGCGCDAKLGKLRRGFKPGHDAKLKSRLRQEGKWK